MRCKKHLADFSSSVGVCASCLRERLAALLATQAGEEDRRKSEPVPPPLAFPRSVSPYVSRRKSDTSASDQHPRRTLWHQRFYSTPQIGPSGGVVAGNLCDKPKSRFSLFFRLFRSKSKEMDPDPGVSDRSGRDSSTASVSSPSWFSSVLSRHRRKQSRFSFPDESTAGLGRRTGRERDRGMSPARVSDCGGEGACQDASSGYSSESSQGWRQTPMRPGPAVRRGGVRLSSSRNASGLTFCFSPLVRASPSRHWSQKGMPPETAFSSEIRAPAKPHLSAAASSWANRSRKLADIGRFNLNH
ncbi:uncharacterized protein LOC127813964 [Diospyros lotus]|uniref:uncharacterized protein LOC127813964 n=1 Tax=Diospyros lotus TaxID=55363 RepID=UPI002251E380|nr:uncharacterized protein LOC127813964 [Diospyros lotus]XP_052211083.1 uncharacterized protein LOC127813964 [Diospyros lotus]